MIDYLKRSLLGNARNRLKLNRAPTAASNLLHMTLQMSKNVLRSLSCRKTIQVLVRGPASTL